MSLDDLPLFSPRAPDEGERRKSEGMALADAAEPEVWKRNCDAAIASLAASGVGFTSEEVRAIAGPPAHFNAMGARFVAAAKRGLIRKDGRRKATRAAAQATELTVWVGK